MPTCVAAIDLRDPIPALGLDPRFDGMLLLARLGRRPVGVIYLPRPYHSHRYAASEVRQILARELGWQTWNAAALDFEPEPPLPPISVVVCTRDRPRTLRRCLEALSNLHYPDYEVVVVDNASKDDGTARAAAEFGMRCVREDRPGLDWARNRGIAEARHALIAYTDDDVRVDPGWLRGVALAFADPRVDAVTGLVLPAEMETAAQEIFERYGGMSKGFKPRLFQRDHLSHADLIGAHQCGVGANMAFRRATLEQLGGFDTALDVGTPSFGGGDIDMFHRVLAAGFSLYYEPTALVWHQHRRDMPGLRRQIYSNGRAFGVYLYKIWQKGTAPRPEVARYAARWLGGWVLRRLALGLRRRLNVPINLAWQEFRGALDAPKAYRATYESDAQIRARFASQPESQVPG